MQKYKEILDFWFGNIDKLSSPEKNKIPLWFMKSDELDNQIKEKFSGELENVIDNANYLEEADKALALIILIDQFSRNIFRNNKRAFEKDHIALDTALKAINKGFDKQFHPVKRIFFYLPLEHSEDLEMQNKCVKIMKKMVDEIDPILKTDIENYYNYALKHRDIIKMFGRFPHRNKILGRDSTPEELVFLEKPGSSF